MNNDQIIGRIFIAFIYKFLSPVIIGSGTNDETDQDLLLNGDGVPFIPGTSIAGVLRHSLLTSNDNQKEKDIIQQLFGKRENGDSNDHFSQISQLYIYDAYLPDNHSYSISVRDGIKIEKQTKTVEEDSKYNYQVLDPDCEFEFHFEVVIRKGDDEEAIKGILFKILKKLENKEIRFGAKTNRGFGYGKLKRESIKILDLSFSNPDEKIAREAYERWIDFKWKSFTSNINVEQWKSFCKQDAWKEWFTLIIPFELQTSILIRQYVNEYVNDLNSADCIQLMSNKNSVTPRTTCQKALIPGTTWNGVFRHHVYRIMKEFGKSDSHIDDIMNTLFGYVDEKKKDARASRIRFNESTICGGSLLKQTRIKIDRFTGGAANSALFDSMPYYHGKTKLKIEIKNPQKFEIGLLLLVIKDLQEGYVSVGGETSIGRGILNGKQIFYIKDGKKKEIDLTFIEDHFNALADYLMSRKGEALK